MARQHHGTASAIGLSLTLCACGGGGSDISYVPPPPPAPPPVQDSGPPAFPDAAFGLVGGPFTTYSASFNSSGDLTSAKDAVHISYSADDDIYTFSAPGVDQGHLTDTAIQSGSYTTSSNWDQIYYTRSFVTQGDNTVPQENASVYLNWATAPYSVSDLTYTSFGSWTGTGAEGAFVYGIPSTVGDIPVTGTANYSGQIYGQTTGDYSLTGSIGLEFDFGAGTLSGAMEPYVSTNDGWDSASLGTYTFRDTVYSVGGTSFSGAFSVPGSDAPSSFQGNFNGPGAVELMGNFSAPYLSPNTGNWGTMTGVFGGKKTP